MASIKLDWTNPTGATDIVNICVHRFDTDESATYANDTALDAATAEAFAAAAPTVLNLSDATYTYSDGAVSFTDTTAVNGTTYTYGVFSKNAGGYGPGEAQTISA